MLVASSTLALFAKKSEIPNEWSPYLFGGVILAIVVSFIVNAVADRKLLQSDDADAINIRGCRDFPNVDVKWFKRAIELGDPVGYFNLGVCYREGRGVPVNLKLAYDNFRQAAELGDPDAAFWCGAMWAQQGDDKQAVEWFRRGQHATHKCLLRLARAFEEGSGVPVNRKYAEVLREEAKEMQERTSKYDYKRLKGKITTRDGERKYTYTTGSSKNRQTHTFIIREDF